MSDNNENSALSRIVSSAEYFPFGFLAYQKNTILTANQKLLEMCGFTSLEEMLQYTDNNVHHLLSDDEVLSYEEHIIHLITKSGRIISCRCTLQKDDSCDVMMLYLYEYNEDEDRNVYDSISGLYDKDYLSEWIGYQLKDKSSVFYQDGWNMLFINISGFRSFNDDCGYAEGNTLLHAFGRLLEDTFETKLAVRIYADQFSVLYQGNDVEEKVRILHEKALQLRSDFFVWVSAGIYQVENWNDSLNIMLDCARTACQYAAEDRKTAAVYTTRLKNELERKKYIAAHIDEAIEKGWLVLYFQPVVRTLNQKICSGEALARWIDPVYGMIPPSQFVPVLEENRLSYKLAEFVIDQAAGYISEAERMGMYPIPVSINLSRRDFDDMDPFETVEKAVRKYHISRNLLCIEITESTVMENPEKIREYVSRFHKAGYEVWMDDFGSAYSSLNTLKDFYFDEIKLDMAFMRNFNERAKKIVASCINMAKDLGIHTLCEGVETKEQAEFLLEHGCEKIQGFYYSKPRSVTELKAMIDSGVFSYETSVERFLFDAAGEIKMNPDQAEAVLMAEEGHLIALEISPRLLKEMESAGISGIELRSTLDNEETDLWQRLKEALNHTRKTKQKEEISYFLEGKYYVISLRPVAENKAGFIFTLRFSDITESARGLVLSNADSLTRSLASTCDCIYRISLSKQELQVVVSSFSGEMAGRTFQFDGESMSAFIYWQDRERFKKWISRDNLEKLMKNQKARSMTDIFRIQKPDGTRQWETFTLIKDTESDLIFCMKTAEASVEGIREMLSGRTGFIDTFLFEKNTEDKMMTSERLWNSLMDQENLKIFRKDRSGRLTGVSRSYLDYFGMNSDKEVLGRTINECPWILYDKTAYEAEQAVLNKGETTGWHLSKVIVNGAVKETVLLKYPVYKEGVIIGLTGIFIDCFDLEKALGKKTIQNTQDPETGVMNLSAWHAELSEFEDNYNRFDEDYSVGVLTVRSYWKIYHEFGWKTAEQTARIASETLRAELDRGCVIGRIDGETFAIVSESPAVDLNRALKRTSELLAETHYIGACSGMIASCSASACRSETNNPLRTVSLSLERAENEERLHAMAIERSPRISTDDPETPQDAIVTYEEVEQRIKTLLHSFEFVRLADPEKKKVLRFNHDGSLHAQKGSCFDIWQTGASCENCISERTLSSKEKLAKFETDGENVFIVISQYLEVDQKPCVLEMVTRMNDSSLLGSDERGIFIRTLANCRAKMYADSLTGIHNRRYYEDVLADQEMDAAALIDIADLRSINEKYGHLAGDSVIKAAGNAIDACINYKDIVRYEGDRFLVCFEHRNDLEKSLHYLQKTIASCSFDTYVQLHVQVRIGACAHKGKVSELLDIAETALQKAEESDQDIVIEK